jgi:hypothetical protein
MLDLASGEKWESVVILIRRRTAAERSAEVQKASLPHFAPNVKHFISSFSRFSR